MERQAVGWSDLADGMDMIGATAGTILATNFFSAAEQASLAATAAASDAPVSHIPFSSMHPPPPPSRSTTTPDAVVAGGGGGALQRRFPTALFPPQPVRAEETAAFVSPAAVAGGAGGVPLSVTSVRMLSLRTGSSGGALQRMQILNETPLVLASDERSVGKVRALHFADDDLAPVAAARVSMDADRASSGAFAMVHPLLDPRLVPARQAL